MVSPYQGMPPVAKSTFGLLEVFSHNSENPNSLEVSERYSVDGWQLPGHGQALEDCGRTLVFGCLDVEAHRQANLDREVVGKVFVDLRRRSCLRAVCPTCYEKWAAKEAHKIEYRFSNWHGSGRPIHVTISVPERLWAAPLEVLRSVVYKIAARVGIYGGSCIVHPFRQKCKLCGSPKDTFTDRCLNCGCSEFSWVFSPHFHIIGFGWVNGDRVSEISKKEGWVTVNLGVRDSVNSTAFYQLSHAGVKEGKHTVTWFGRLAYNKLKVVPEVVEKPLCPLCKAELVKLHWAGLGEMPFTEEGQYFDDPENWVRGSIFPGGG